VAKKVRRAKRTAAPKGNRSSTKKADSTGRKALPKSAAPKPNSKPANARPRAATPATPARKPAAAPSTAAVKAGTADGGPAAMPVPAAAASANNAVVPKSPLSKKDLQEFIRLLLQKRTELVGDVNHLRSEALHEGEEGAVTSTLPIHMADISSDRWEQEFTLGLMESEQKLLREIDAALARVSNGTFGICEATHKPISKMRLRAKPWARFCIEYARQQELGRLP
jgi:RNA polymerase-binding protein DksA